MPKKFPFRRDGRPVVVRKVGSDEERGGSQMRNWRQNIIVWSNWRSYLENHAHSFHSNGFTMLHCLPVNFKLKKKSLTCQKGFDLINVSISIKPIVDMQNISSQAPRLPSTSCASALRPRPFWKNHHENQHQSKISNKENLIDNRDGFFSRSFVFPTCSENVWGSEDLPSLWYKLLTTSPDIVCEYLKRYHLWISWKIGRSVSRGSNFILTVVLLKTLQDKLKLYHWNFERMMDESSITASKRLISKEEVIFLVNEAFRFMTVYERKRAKVFFEC